MRSISEFFKSFESNFFKPRGNTILYYTILYYTILILPFGSLTSTAYAEPDTIASETVPYTFTSGTTAQSSQVNANFTYLANRSWSLSGSNLYYSGGNVGIGTSSPQSPLHIVTSNGVADGAGITFSDASSTRVGTIGICVDTRYPCVSFGFGTQTNNPLDFGVNGGIHRFSFNTSGYFGIDLNWDQTSYPLHMKSGAYVTSGGVWTNASSREYKKDIKALSSEDAMVAFNQLEPVSFKYKNDDEQHVGFIAEDVPDLVASGDRKGLSSMDMVAVLTKVVQEQQKAIAMLSKEVKSLKAKVKNNKTAALTKQSN